MGELLIALKHGTQPPISGRDNLETLKLVEAVYRSAQEHRMIELAAL